MAMASTAVPICSPPKGGSSFKILEDEANSHKKSPLSAKTSAPASSPAKPNTPVENVPLASSKLGSMQDTPTSKVEWLPADAELADVLIPRLHANMAQKQKIDHSTTVKKEVRKSSMDALLERLSKQQIEYEVRKNSQSGRSTANPSTATPDVTPSATTSADFSSASKGSLEDTPICNKLGPIKQNSTEFNKMIRLKKELDAAKDKIARQERELTELTEPHFKKQTPGPAPAASYINGMQEAYTAQRGGQQQFNHADDARSDISDALSARSMHHGQYRNQFQNMGNYGQPLPANRIWGQAPQRPFANRPFAPNLAPLMVPQGGARQFAGQPSPISANSFAPSNGYGYSRGNRSRAALEPISAGSYGTVTSDEMTPLSMFSVNNPISRPMGQMGNFQAPQATYQPRPIGAPLSATAAEFNANAAVPWDSRSESPGQTFVPTTEPLNYRRLLDKSVSCNWKYIVDKIVHNNDQQASIFLQQKLKLGTAEQKYDIVESIVAQAYPLMVNRFGNFLVQRCFEHGTPEQVVSIAHAIRGNTLSLSMDPFGCHVVQKAFDAVPEEYKAIMVHELLRRIPETVIHRYACHVWQKLFELRWSDSPPQIMKYVNEALRGMWHEVALGETGSLVVQNIFENCLEEDKRPCIEEVLNSIDIVAHGQFGNWCIQHICEHGAPADRTRATDHVLKYATEYSMDQFASKVVEKCLKIGSSDFLERYLGRVCEGRPDRPRIPLIDIASDQYGNYLIQYVLTHASTQHRELVASHIRKHMVSLRGSKFGSRVGMLCSNPAYATRPGPGVGAQTQRYMPSSTYNNQAAPSNAAVYNGGQGYATNAPMNNGGGNGNGRAAGNFH